MRINGSFKYKTLSQVVKDPETGLRYSSGGSDWQPGCECQIDKQIPAKQVIGTDGQAYTYSYDVFIPKYFRGELVVGAAIQLYGEDGSVDEIQIKGIDNLNRKYIEVWG
nr:MAG TPA: hypothetical protein [Caudoviricetes sp.]